MEHVHVFRNLVEIPSFSAVYFKSQYTPLTAS